MHDKAIFTIKETETGPSATMRQLRTKYTKNKKTEAKTWKWSPFHLRDIIFIKKL